jgi:hypothetical protein
MKTSTFTAGFYQLNNDGERTFNIELNGSIINEIKADKLSNYLTNKLFLLSGAIAEQKANNNGKHLFKGFKTSQPIYFYFVTEDLGIYTQSENLTILLKSFTCGKLVSKDLFNQTLEVLISLQLDNTL